MKKEIRNFKQQIIGYIEEKPNGDKVATNFIGQILGYYYANEDVTKDFCGRILYHGDMLVSLIKEE